MLIIMQLSFLKLNRWISRERSNKLRQNMQEQDSSWSTKFLLGHWNVHILKHTVLMHYKSPQNIKAIGCSFIFSCMFNWALLRMTWTSIRLDKEFDFFLFYDVVSAPVRVDLSYSMGYLYLPPTQGPSNYAYLVLFTTLDVKMRPHGPSTSFH